MSCTKNCECSFKEGGKIAYELHLTVAYDPTFIDFCKSHGVKVVDIDVGEGIPSQLMTSYACFQEDYKEVYWAFHKLVVKAGYDIKRIKIETSLNNPISERNEDSYYEAHFSVTDEISEEFCEGLKLHKSRNLLKTKDTKVQMLTYRDYCKNKSDFTIKCEQIKAMLLENDTPCVKMIQEYTLTDTNVALDDQWLKIKTIT